MGLVLPRDAVGGSPKRIVSSPVREIAASSFLFTSWSKPTQCSLIEFSGADKDEVRRPLDDLADNGVLGIPVPGRHGDGETFKVGGEGAGIALEEISLDADREVKGKRGFPGRHI